MENPPFTEIVQDKVWSLVMEYHHATNSSAHNFKAENLHRVQRHELPVTKDSTFGVCINDMKEIDYMSLKLS